MERQESSVSRTNDGSTQQRSPELQKDSPAPIEAKKSRILLMDDEEIVRNVATDMLSSLGHDVESASDGQEAIESFIRAREGGKPFDLVILDLTVRKGMAGEETIRRIREIDPDVPAVVSSGDAESPAVVGYREHGFSAVLNKPYRIAAMKECLNGLLKQS